MQSELLSCWLAVTHLVSLDHGEFTFMDGLFCVCIAEVDHQKSEMQTEN